MIHGKFVNIKHLKICKLVCLSMQTKIFDKEKESPQ